MPGAALLGVMSAYNDYDGYPIQSSGYWLGERLRKDFGFRGYVVSDSDAVEYLHTKHRVSPDMKESVYQSVMGGSECALHVSFPGQLCAAAAGTGP